jgi:hypothetical protein
VTRRRKFVPPVIGMAQGVLADFARIRSTSVQRACRGCAIPGASGSGLDPQGYHANDPVQECPESTGPAAVGPIEHTAGSKALNEDFLGGIGHVLKTIL